jgi:hypothetical protein
MKRVTNGFASLGIAQFTQQLQLIVSRMTGNTNFTSLQTEVQALSTEAANFYALATKAASRDTGVILARDASREKVINMLHDLGMDVTAIAKGDVEILASSGFPYTQPKRTSPPMEKPAPPKLASGTNNGEIECKTFTQVGMKSVNYYITADSAAIATEGTSGWNVTSFNKTKYTFDSLVPGQRYHIKVGLVGVRGQEVISNAVSYIAQ